MATPNCGACVLSFKVTCYMFTNPPTIYFLIFIFPFLFTSTGTVISFTTEPSYFANFLFLMWILLLIPHPLIGPLIFRDLVYLYQVVDAGQILCIGLILYCRSFRAIAMMLHRMAFHLSGKVVALHLDNSTAKAYLSN